MKIEQHDMTEEFADVPALPGWKPATKRQSTAAAVLLLVCIIGTGLIAVAMGGN